MQNSFQLCRMPMFEIKNQIANKVHLRHISQRIVSLVPSVTELLHDLGLENQVVGITKFCTKPMRWRVQKTTVGGTKNIDIERIRQLNPTMIFAAREENVKEQIESLAQDFPIYICDIKKWEDALEMMGNIGAITGTSTQAASICGQVRNAVSSLQSFPTNNKPTVCYLIWRKPYMTVGGDTYISDMLELCGFQNVFSDTLRYPVVELEQIAASQCDFVFLSTEPYPFREKHFGEMKSELEYLTKTQKLFSAEIMLVDGEMFSWYGSRLLPAVAYFKRLREQVFVCKAASF